MTRESGRGRLRVLREVAGRQVLLAYLIPSLISLIAIQTWFEPGTAIASADLPPPFVPEANYTSHWSHLTAGEGSPAYNIVGLPYAAWLDAWTSLGASEELAQRIWLSALFAGSSAAVVFLAFGFTASALAAGTAGLLVSFNAYRLVLGADAIPMAAILVAALLGGFIARAALRPDAKGSVVGFAIASVGLGYVMTNPPHVALVALWVATCIAVVLVVKPTATRRTLGFLARSVPLALLLNAWWIVPAWLTITGSTFGDRFAAAGVDEWAWTHERATLGNALTLNTSWGWSYPEFFPYADGLGDPPFNLLKFSLPVLAAIGVVLARREDRRLALGLALVAVAAMWLATGLRAPLPAVNRWLYDYVPGFWLFREPSKFLLFVLLPMALLGGIAVSRLFGVGRRRLGLRALALVFVATAMLYVHPLFTGEVIPDERPPLPSAHVELPNEWREAAETVNAQPDGGKVLVLPRSDFYQVPTTWGYYGTSFTRSIVRRPVLEVAPGGYFQQPAGVASLEESIETDLVMGRPAGVGRKLEALGVRYVLLRRDVDVDFPDRRIARPNILARGLKRVPGVSAFRSVGAIDIYRVDGETGDEVFAAAPILYADSSNALAQAVGVLEEPPGFITETDGQRTLAQIGLHPSHVVRFEEEMVRRLAVKAQGDSLQLRLADPFRVSVEGRQLPGISQERVTRLPTDAPVVITAGNAVHLLRRLSPVWRELGPVRLRQGQSLDIWRFAGVRFAQPEAAGPVGDCYAVDARGAEEVGIRAAVMESDGRPTIRLSARAHSACVTFPLVLGRTSDLYTVRFRYRQLQGARARACLWQAGLNRCARVPELQPSREWRTFAGVIRPDRRMTSLTLYLYADGRERAPATVTEYQPVQLERYRHEAAVPYALARIPLPAQTQFPQGTVAVTHNQLSRPVSLTNPGEVGDCHRYDERTPGELGLAARVVDRPGSPVLQLAARDHSACVTFPIASFEAGPRDYRVHVEFRQVQGPSPRACLWQVGPDRCVSISDLGSDGDWRVLDRTLRLDSNVRGLKLILYADGDGNGLTVAEYRDVHVEPVRPLALLGYPARQPLPRIVARREEPWKFRVRVEGAQAPFLLATSEAYAHGWKASADGRDDSELRHVEINGYANGWLVPWRGSYELTLEYGPERYAQAARWLSLIAGILVLLWLAVRGVRWLLARRTYRAEGQPAAAFRLPHFGKEGSRRPVQRGSGG